MFQHGTARRRDDQHGASGTYGLKMKDDVEKRGKAVKRQSLSYNLLTSSPLSTVYERRLSISDTALNVFPDSDSSTNHKRGSQKGRKKSKFMSVLLKSKRKDSHGDDDSSKLRSAVRKSNTSQVIEILSDQKTDVDGAGQNGITALHEASIDGNLVCMKLLVTHGADVNICDYEGFTPLDYATFGGNFECASYLIQNGATEDRIKDGQILYRENITRKSRSATC